MDNKFRDKAPVRTFKKTYAKYSQYKQYLAGDFFNRCGYTDCCDFWFGGVNNFHIDHFIPWKNYPARPELKTSYKNLVYCCSYVNILKSNDETNYLDPCDNDFNDHFRRGITGEIIPIVTSSAAQYMYKKLKLYLMRYEVIWMLDKIAGKMQDLKTAIEKTHDSELRKNLLITNGELGMLMSEYLDYLKRNQ